MTFIIIYGVFASFVLTYVGTAAVGVVSLWV